MTKVTPFPTAYEPPEPLPTRAELMATGSGVPNLWSIIYAEALEVDDLKHFFGTMALAALLAFGGQLAWAQDFQKGLDAYNAGDFETALQEWRPLAEQGDAFAQDNLGLMYRMGKGVPQDDAEAAKWYRLAAEQGNAKAQRNLGGMFRNGEGVIQDNFYAHMWFNIAASLGHETAKEGRKLAASKMTAEDISKAQQLARECVAKDYRGC
jgi:TPR repeat protein